MRILNINSYYYSSSVHKQLQDALNAYNIFPITYTPLEKGTVPREECKYNNEKLIEKSECYNRLERYIFHLKNIRILRDLEQRINIEEYDFLHSHSLFSNGYIALKIKQKYGLPYIVAVRDSDLNYFFKYMIHLRALGRQILKESSYIVFLSKAYRDQLIQKYIPQDLREEILNKTLIIPNGINNFWLNNIGNAKKINVDNKIKLIYVGKINKRKNITTTINAIEVLRTKGYDIKFTVVGKIVDQMEFKKIKDLPYVNYVSNVSKEELIYLYRENDIFVMPSITETFGLVYAEAMSQGLPVIYTKGQGFDGQFEDGIVGYSVSCCNAEEIASKVIETVKNYHKMSCNCITNVRKFCWKKISNEYIKIYSDINL